MEIFLPPPSRALEASYVRGLKGQFHEIFGFLNGYTVHRKKIVSRSTANIFKTFMLCCHCVIPFKRSNAVNAKNLPISCANRNAACTGI
jgi:hypothetical protein